MVPPKVVCILGTKLVQGNYNILKWFYAIIIPKCFVEVVKYEKLTKRALINMYLLNIPYFKQKEMDALVENCRNPH